MIVRDGKADKPLLENGKPVTLRDALTELAASGKVGKGGLVVLDTDGAVVTTTPSVPVTRGGNVTK